MISKLLEPAFCFRNFSLGLVNNWLRWACRRSRAISFVIWWLLSSSCILDKRLLTSLAHLFLVAFTTLLVALFDKRACIIFATHRDLCAIDSILAIENIGTFEVNFRSVYVFDHIVPQFGIVVRHG